MGTYPSQNAESRNLGPTSLINHALNDKVHGISWHGTCACAVAHVMVCNRAAMRNEDLPDCLLVCLSATPGRISGSLVVPCFRRLIPVIWGHFRRNWAEMTDVEREREHHCTVVSDMHAIQRGLKRTFTLYVPDFSKSSN